MNMKKSANVILCMILAVAFAISLVVFSSALTPKGLFRTGQEVSVRMEPFTGAVVLERVQFDREPNNWIKAQFLVENRSDREVKNLKIRCEFFDKAGQFCDSKNWILHSVSPAGKQMEYLSQRQKFISSRAGDLRDNDCFLVDLTVKPSINLSEGHGSLHDLEPHPDGHDTPSEAGGGHSIDH